MKEINFVPERTYLSKPYRVFEILSLIQGEHERAPYRNKRGILRLLSEAVDAGANIGNQERHIRNIDNMLGKNRIFD